MYKCSIHILRPFKYNNTCELCDNILDKYKKRIIMVRKYFVTHEEVIYVFHEKYFITKIEKKKFNLSCVRILGAMECKNINFFPVVIHQNIYNNKSCS